MTLLLQKLHGHLAILAVAASLHPALTLRGVRRPSGRMRLSSTLAAGATLAATALGWVVYPPYRVEVKQRLYLHDVRLGQAFEIKEHLAWYALCLALAGGAMVWAARGERAGELTRAARVMWIAASVCGLATAALGIAVASQLSFAYPLAP